MIFIEKTERRMSTTNPQKVQDVTVTIHDVDEKDAGTAVDIVLDEASRNFHEFYKIYWAFDEKSFKAVSRTWDTDITYISAKAL